MKGLQRQDGENVTNTEFEKIVREYSHMVYRVALNMCRNPENSEDIMQNVFLRLYKYGKTELIASKEHLKAWLIKVTVNESKRLLKSIAKMECVNLEEVANTLFAEDSDGKEVFTQVMNLEEKYRVVIYLYYYEGYSTKEIADILSRNEATVRTQLSRAREMLKLSLEEDNYD